MNSAGGGGCLHIVMLPWLALGHLLPFMELSKRLAQHGHRISFFATPKNIRRLPRVPPHLSSLIHFVELRMPAVEHLPPGTEASIDLPSDHLRPYLRRAFDSFHHQLSEFLRQSTPPGRLPDWILFDYAAHWVPGIAAESGVPCAYLCLHDAAVMSFFGSPATLMGGEGARTTPEEYMELPEWIPFESPIFYKPHEARELFEPGVLPDESGVSESYRFGRTMESCGLIAIRSSTEYEAKWLDLLRQLNRVPVIPVGFFPPSPQDDDLGAESGSRWGSIRRWLDGQKDGSVVYAAFGSEVKLRSAQVREIALGLEKSELPFLWALRAPAGGDGGAESLLPEGFEEKTAGRGLVWVDWVPQPRVLRHRSVGGFLTHAGWNSIVEGLSVGLALVLMPLMFDQGLNSRDMVERGVGVEVPRAEEDGAFTGEGIAGSLRLVMVEEQGEQVRAKAKEFREVFGSEETNDRYVRQFVEYLEEHGRKEEG